MSHLVFVFGTLKKGFPNHPTMAQQTLLGEYETEQPYPLYLVGDRNSPWMMDQPGEGMKVTGQVYKVDDDCLSALDKLERIHSADGYRRQQINVVKIHSTLKIKALCYLKPLHQLKPASINSGPLAEYLPQHARLYRSRSA